MEVLTNFLKISIFSKNIFILYILFRVILIVE